MSKGMRTGFAAWWLLLGVPICLVPPCSAQPATADQGQAAFHLALAKVYLRAGDPVQAEERVREAIKAAPEASRLRTDALRLLAEVLERKDATEQARRQDKNRRVRALLGEAERLVAEGRLDEAVKLTTETLKDIEEPTLLRMAEAQLEAAHPSWLRAKWAQLVARGWLGDAFIVLLVIALCWLALRLLRWLLGLRRRFFGPRRWLVAGIDDKTGLGLGDLVIGSLQQWRAERTPRAAGLLNLEAIRLETAPRFTGEAPRVDFASALASLPEVGAVAPGAVAKVLELLPSWLRARRPTITGSTAVLEGQAAQVAVRLTSRSSDGRLRTVGAVAAKEASACVAAAEEASFKMYYLLANDSTIGQADAANSLRVGLQQLRAYLSTGQAGALDLACQRFTDARSHHPELQEALFYEGVALDLQERHEDAEARFHHLATTAGGDLRERARYNEAIAKFRQYRADQLQRAIEMLEALISDLPVQAPDRLKKLTASPIKALAQAAKANAIAHRSIFWQRVLFNGTKEEEVSKILERKREARERVEAWIEDVEVAATELDAVYRSVSSGTTGQQSGLKARLRSCWERATRRARREGSASPWDDLTVRQLQWATENARSNAYLNHAISFLVEPHLAGAGEAELRRAYLEKAETGFRKCEMLLAPGVETLTNLATVYLSLGRLDRAREYCGRAKALNASYEYAYFREAQAWEKQGGVLKAKEVMQSLPRQPVIPEFQAMFRQYGVEPRAA